MNKLIKLSLYTFLAFFALSSYLLLYYILGDCANFEGFNFLIILSFPVYFFILLLMPLYFLIGLIREAAKVTKGKKLEINSVSYLLMFAIFAGILFVLRVFTASVFCKDIL